MIRTFYRIISFIPAMIILYMIFGFSSQDATSSSQLSLEISYEIVETATQILDSNLNSSDIDLWANKIHTPIRKLAHFSEYLLLGLSIAFPLFVCGLRGKSLILFSLFLCVIFAYGDEFHQSFVDGRSREFRDVCIDSSGSFCGILFFQLLQKIFLFIKRIVRSRQVS